jgi:hypothetical protein
MKSLIEEIKLEFDGLEVPGDDELLHRDCLDDVDILEFYGGIAWRDMSHENIVYNYAAPTAFSPKAFQYYLPAFLIWTLNNADSQEIAGESILLALDPGTDKEHLHEFRKSKFSQLTSKQIGVIKKFLWHLELHPMLGEFAERALVNYWIDCNTAKLTQ